ncbi:lipoprotein insertase outer membrane protein LolB [Uliginosibacterium aquaticum]|uniref:Outer-membrane lipoprotein LolB n=1 Tax=Uliginosibacterium aquaticum TaxID=2731212 RepID=A0ABX2IHJ5_9RHOO|nr:lipoprotein insertase outer membrane protein LolB [Uliginosibacterium aquaticum]NSL56281.1 outer membrane lipoprotein LolB [Uliginosibacterium aquaticum]
MKRLLLALITLLLTACASTPPAPQEIPPRPARDSVQKFALSGRVAIDQGKSANNVRIMWEHNRDSDSLGFASPLGNMLAELQSSPKGARWTSADGELYEARTPERLMTHFTDTPIPLNALSQWVLGRLSVQASEIRRDAQGRLLDALDQGWAVRITGYESEQANALPRTLEIEQPGLRLKLVIEEWFI